MLFTVSISGLLWHFVVMIPRRDWYAIIDTIKWLTLGMGFMFLVISLVAGLVSSIVVARPIAKMNKDMKQISTKFKNVGIRKHASRFFLKKKTNHD